MTAWLKSLREVCTERAIVLIFDEVFVGFRPRRRRRPGIFGVHADMVTYGKSLQAVFRSRGLRTQGSDAPLPRRPPRRCLFARGTFNSHPYVMTAME